MIFVANRNLVPAIKTSLTAWENRVLRYCGIALVFLITFLLTGRSAQDMLVLGGMLLVIGAVFFFIPAVRGLSRLKNVVCRIEIVNGQVLLDTVDITLLKGIIRSPGKRVSAQLGGIEGMAIQNNVLPLPYMSEIFVVSRSSRRFYLIAVFFDDYEKIKSSLI